jgi:hypothetical protein
MILGYLLEAGQFKVKAFAEQSQSGQLVSTPLSGRSLLMLYHEVNRIDS